VRSGALFILLAAHDFIKARRARRTGVVEGMMSGFWGKLYSRKTQADAFWVNVCAGFFVAALGAVAVLWALAVTVLATWTVWDGSATVGIA
jgi:hypothetical protein